MATDIYVKIRNGTRSSSTDLCRTCNRCTIIKGAAEGSEERYCHAASYDNPPRLRHLVSECSEYYNRDLPSLSDLQKTAWILETTKGRRVGFVPYRDWRAAHRDEETIPE